MKPTRELIKEGQVLKLIKGQEATCMLFVFTDSLLLTQVLRDGEELRVLIMMSLYNATIKGPNLSSVPKTISGSSQAPPAPPPISLSQHRPSLEDLTESSGNLSLI